MYREEHLLHTFSNFLLTLTKATTLKLRTRIVQVFRCSRTSPEKGVQLNSSVLLKGGREGGGRGMWVEEARERKNRLGSFGATTRKLVAGAARRQMAAAVAKESSDRTVEQLSARRIDA
ncbi:hypothetical protein EVAR_103486_1 [Eumeta japonica]|uniref:Uncharacterized protein n=1 Tax=Eumeta variegata TaxID=151549 RepID=A0A4C1ZL73_EUMVA|nr:hypothetical protein EVAR_103486_1 [Eumeta japonica]